MRRPTINQLFKKPSLPSKTPTHTINLSVDKTYREQDTIRPSILVLAVPYHRDLLFRQELQSTHRDGTISVRVFVSSNKESSVSMGSPCSDFNWEEEYRNQCKSYSSPSQSKLFYLLAHSFHFFTINVRAVKTNVNRLESSYALQMNDERSQSLHPNPIPNNILKCCTDLKHCCLEL